jgi:hypothetical protein
MRRRLLDLWAIGDDSFGVMIASLPHPLPSAATEAEASGAMPGDRLTPDAMHVRTQAVAAPVGPRRVWPWLAQMMRGAGVYGWGRLETPAVRSAEFLVEAPGAPAEGDAVGDLFEISHVSAGSAITWRSRGEIEFFGLTLDDLVLDFRLLRAGPRASRIMGRLRCTISGSSAPVVMHAVDVLEFILPHSQIRNMARLASAPRPGETPAGQAIHQHAAFRARASLRPPPAPRARRRAPARSDRECRASP